MSLTSVRRPTALRGLWCGSSCVRVVFSVVCVLWFSTTASQAAFEALPVGELAVPGPKSLGGVAWADFDNDGCLDAVINADDGAHLFQQRRGNDGRCTGRFDEVRTITPPRADLRSAVWGDADNDGRVDLALNRYDDVIVYFNTDGSAAGLTQGSDFLPNNSEGMAWMDFDADGDLDLLTEDNSVVDGAPYGLRIYRNTSGRFDTSDFLAITGTALRNGDYLAATDYDADGDVDFYVRRDGSNDIPEEADLFTNNGDGTFSPNYDINEFAINSDKGGAAFCDLDNDGDFDLVRTNSGLLGLFEQMGVASGSFTYNPTTVITGDFSAVACADVDNDGDEDLFFSAGDTGVNALFINQGGFVFEQDNLNIRPEGVGRGVAFADYDRDGDMDLLVNKHNAASELWRNQHNGGDDYLMVRLTQTNRDALGATVRLFDCDQQPLSGVKEINGGMGRGSQNAPLAHFAVADPAQTVVVQARFVGGRVVRRAVVPGDLSGYRLVVVDRDDPSNDAQFCVAPQDSDGDGVNDARDADRDNDGIADRDEGGPTRDTDGDGVPDVLDLDSDGDGMWDLVESGADASSLDRNNDGRIDDTFGTGENGIADVIETFPDSGVVDYDGDGVGDAPRHSDDDGVADFLDLDSDNDSISDVVEAGGRDPDTDGRVPPGGSGVVPVDTDDDGIPDYRDLDTDSDKALDVVEAGRDDVDGDGRIDDFRDGDGDGFDDGTPFVDLVDLPDTDRDGIADFRDNDDADGDGVSDALDPDDDNDGISDADEGDGQRDTDGDGVPDSRDLDSDNDGLLDDSEAGDGGTPRDSDDDGVPDYLDLDSDNDSILDVIEAGGDDPDGDGRLGNGSAEGVGPDGLIAPAPLTPVHSDEDGLPDHLDLDSDNDGIPDLREALTIDDNSRFDLEPIVDENGDGWDDNVAASPPPVPDTDGDGDADYRDLNTDADSRNDVVEAGGLDDDGDHRLDGFTDDNGNGYDDVLEVTPLPVPDDDGDGVPEYRDPESAATPQEPDDSDAPAAPGSEPRIKTAVDGAGGCTVNPRAGFDPVLPLLVIMATLYGFRRRGKVLGVLRFPLRSLSSARHGGRTMVVCAGVAVSLALSAASFPVAAAAQRTEQWYGGLGLGMSRLKPDPTGTPYKVADERDFGGQVFLGYDLLKFISIEGFFADLGAAQIDPSGAVGYQAFGVGGVFYINLPGNSHEGLRAFASAGIGRINNDSELPVERLHDAQFYYGPGVEYSFGNGWIMRAAMALYDKDAALTTVSLMRRFGGKVIQPPRAAVAPAAAEAEAPSAPVAQAESAAFAAPVVPPPVPVDQDGDGVADAEDDCLGTPAGVAVDEQGCPWSFPHILFAFDSAALNDEARKNLNNVAEKLRSLTDIRVDIIGHADSTGPAEYNQRLSERRAVAVQRYLVDQGMAEQNLRTVGYGETQPVASNETREGRARNRRVELHVVTE